MALSCRKPLSKVSAPAVLSKVRYLTLKKVQVVLPQFPKRDSVGGPEKMADQDWLSRIQ